MAKRVLLVTLPAGADPSQLPEPARVAALVRNELADGRRLVELLLEGEEVEPLLDAIEDRWGAAEGFHAVVLAPEAVLPRAPKEPEVVPPEEPETHADEGRVSREELVTSVAEGLGVSAVFVALTLLSTIVAAVGLLRGDVAVVIGAMVVAPLLRPNIGMALGATLGDLQLVARALRSVVVGAVAALLLSAAIGLFAHLDPTLPALLERARIGWGDFGLALAAGAAGTLAFTRGLAGPVIGVMVAVALLPPLVACGLFAGAGYWPEAGESLMLVLTNTICINLSAIATFLATGIRPHGFWEEEKARRSTRIAVFLWCTLLVALAAVVYLAKRS